MSKKKSRRQATEKRAPSPGALPKKQDEKPAPAVVHRPWSIYGFPLQALIVVLLTVVLYSNTFNNEYALDDGIVILRNEYVQEGISGIPDILTKDAFDSYYRQLNSSNQLQGGRYRPLSIVTFAIEQQFMGALDDDSAKALVNDYMTFGFQGKYKDKVIHEMHVRHVLNVVWYILSLLALLYFLRFVVFKQHPIMALLATVLFALHPLHTEVVANVKSRDEIMSLLFICLTFIFTFKYQQYRRKWLYVASIISFFLALLSKEYAITLVVLLPLSLYLFNGSTIKKAITYFLPFCISIGIYLLLRSHTAAEASVASDNEILNNPYLLATPDEAAATKILTSMRYLKLLLYPNPLSADYSYQSIPYTDFSNLWVWAAVVFYGALIFSFWKLLPKRFLGERQKSKSLHKTDHDNIRNILCFAIAFYFLHFLLVCNWIFDIGAPMGERLIFHSSVGFAIAIAVLIYKIFDSIKNRTVAMSVVGVIMAIIIWFSSVKTMTRNIEWKNNQILFAADFKTVPNSVIVLGNVASTLIDGADSLKDPGTKNNQLDSAVRISSRMVELDPVNVEGFFDRGLAYFRLRKYDMAKNDMDSVRRLYATYPQLPIMYKLISDSDMSIGIDSFAHVGNWNGSITVFRKGLAADSTNVGLWFNLGVALYAIHDVNGAIDAWKTALRMDPNYPNAKQNLNFALGQLNANKALGK